MAGSFHHVSNNNNREQGKRDDMKSKPYKNNNGPAKSSPELVVREQIEKRAHEIWLAAGCCHGDDVGHWLQAEREVLKGGSTAAQEAQAVVAARTSG
jgi:hypothetical protein